RGIGGEAHPRDRFQVGKTGGSERGNGGDRGRSPGGTARRAIMSHIEPARTSRARRCMSHGYVQCEPGSGGGRIDTLAAPAYLSIVAVRSLSYPFISCPRFPCSAP